jgi:hypothetical protein
MREFKSPDEKHAYLARLVAMESLRRLYNSLWLDDSPQYKCGERMPRITTSEWRLANLFSVSIVPPTTEEEAELRAEVAASRIDSMVREYLSIREPILPDIPENGYRVSDRGWACDCVYGGDTWRLFFMAETSRRIKTFQEKMRDYDEKTRDAAFVVIIESDSEKCPTRWYAVWSDGRTDGFGENIIVCNRIPGMLAIERHKKRPSGKHSGKD